VIADAQSAEQEYLERFGVYPINHVIVVRNDVLSANPALPAALMERFSEAKQAAYRRRLGATLVPWADRHWKKMFDLFAGDPLPYGLTVSNRLVVGRLVNFLYDQRLISTPVDVESLFVPEH
jgi:4,5-dihydroxyphthalate decarboxylase